MIRFKVFEPITNSYIGTIKVNLDNNKVEKDLDRVKEIKKSGFILVRV